MTQDESNYDFDLKQLTIALRYTDEGFLCFTTDTAQGQAAVVADISKRFTADEVVFANAMESTDDLSMAYIQRLITSHPARVYVLYNLQLFAKDEAREVFFGRLNFMRDPWARQGKLFLLGMTTSFKNELVLNAPDFNSFFLTTFHFDNPAIDGAEIISLRFGDVRNEAAISDGAMRYARSRLEEWLDEIGKEGVETVRTERLERRYLEMLQAWLDVPDLPYESVVTTITKIVLTLREWSKSWEQSLPNADKLMLIGRVFLQLALYKESLSSFRSAMLIYETIAGKDEPSTAEIYHDIGSVYKAQGDYPKALKWYYKALKIRENVLGVENFYTAATYNNIALVYNAKGEYAKALKWCNKALGVSERVLGMEHPRTATAYNNMGGIYKKQGDCSKALEWYCKALGIQEKILGTEHPDTALMYNNIAIARSRRLWQGANVVL